MITAELVALDALAWTLTHDPEGNPRASVDSATAMREARNGLERGEFRAWNADVQREAARQIDGYYTVHLDELSTR